MNRKMYQCFGKLSPVVYRSIFVRKCNKNITNVLIFQRYVNEANITSKRTYHTIYYNRSIHSKVSSVLVKQSEDKDCNLNAYTYRTHTCGELRPIHAGQTVTLCGWLQYSRLNKFLLLRDAYGLTQCVINSNSSLDLTKIPLESIVKVEGHVILRPKDMINKSLTTGEVEVTVSSLHVLNEASELPFNLRSYQKPKEQLRLQHRHVDLRFPEMQTNLRARSSILFDMRRFLIERNGFVEVETPTLFCRTPGGAREFVVPTHHRGLFYSLVQSPQQFKQMLMSGSVDRYFQIARCYRDESTRPDRQPEFTQLDIEMSFTERDSILELIENMFYETFIKPVPTPPFNRMSYDQAMKSYGSDKPNVTYGLKFNDITDDIKSKSPAYCIKYTSKLGKLTAKSKDQIRQIAKKHNTKIIINEKLSQELGEDNKMQLQLDDNDAIVALGKHKNCCTTLGEVRELLAGLLKSSNLLTTAEDIEPLWVVDFPLFTEGENGLETCHHPFTAPHPEDIHLLDTDPLKVRSLAYDLVINGFEVGGGSVRIHDVELQKKIFKMLKIDLDSMTHFLNALKSGCPPHAGIALGIDRLMVIACNAESIRDVIAFPKNHEGKDPLSGAPNKISDDDKKYYHLC